MLCLPYLKLRIGKIRIILREVLAQRDAERGHVARRGELRGVGQPVRVAKHGALHAERPGLGRHEAGKGGFRTAEQFRQSMRGIIRRAGDQGVDRGLHRHRPAGAHAKLRRGLGRRLRGEDDRRRLLDPSVLEGLEGEIERHHLRQGCRVAARARIGRKQGLAGIGVDDDRRVAQIGGGRGRRRRADDQRETAGGD